MVDPFELELKRLVASQEAKMLRLFSLLSNNSAQFISNGLPSSGLITPELQKQLDSALWDFKKSFNALLTRDVERGWDISGKKNKAFVTTFLKNKKSDKLGFDFNYLGAIKDRNITARTAFMAHKKNGWNISDNIWAISESSKAIMKEDIQYGINDGMSADEIAKLINGSLKDPQTYYTDKNGKRKKKPNANYTYKQGVYKSPFANALRLARSEVNLAYRYADHLNRQTMPFVKGFTVHLSAQHPLPDICDHMAGDYPPKFEFVGWHPMCFCYTTNIQISDSEFSKMLRGDEYKVNKVEYMPKAGEEYIKANQEKLKGMKNKPYWLTNFKDYKQGYGLNNDIGKTRVALHQGEKAIIKKAEKETDGVLTEQEEMELEAYLFGQENMLRHNNNVYFAEQFGVRPENIDAIFSYTSTEYHRDLNKFMNGYTNFLNRSIEFQQKYAKYLDNSLKKIPIKSGVNVSRGEIVYSHPIHGNSINHYKYCAENNVPYEVKGFLSTGIDFKFNSDVTLFINNTKTGRFVDDISYFSGTEREVMFRPNTKLKILSVIDKGSGVWHVIAEEL